MKKKVFKIILLVIGCLAVLFSFACFGMAGAGENFTGTGTFSRTEVMLDDIVDNTRYIAENVATGFGFVLLISGGITIIKALDMLTTKD